MLSFDSIDLEAIAKGGTIVCGGLFGVLLVKDIFAAHEAAKEAAIEAAIEEVMENVVDRWINALDPDTGAAQ